MLTKKNRVCFLIYQKKLKTTPTGAQTRKFCNIHLKYPPRNKMQDHDGH